MLLCVDGSGIQSASPSDACGLGASASACGGHTMVGEPSGAFADAPLYRYQTSRQALQERVLSQSQPRVCEHNHSEDVNTSFEEESILGSDMRDPGLIPCTGNVTFCPKFNCYFLSQISTVEQEKISNTCPCLFFARGGVQIEILGIIFSDVAGTPTDSQPPWMQPPRMMCMWGACARTSAGQTTRA
jgi:hypothetical protein